MHARHRAIACKCKVHVEEWRTALWEEALQAQGIRDAELAAALQHKFRTARLEHFKLGPGVKASRGRLMLHFVAICTAACMSFWGQQAGMVTARHAWCHAGHGG